MGPGTAARRRRVGGTASYDRRLMRARVLAACLGAGVLLALAITAPLASASTTPPPTIALKLGSQAASVKVTWHFTTTAPQSQRVVEVARSTDGDTWAPLTRRAKAPKVASFVDK